MTESEPQAHTSAADSIPLHPAPETQSWLSTPPTGGGLPPPVQTQNQLLPLSELGWDDFERLCFRLIRDEVGQVRAAIYGVPGQAQGGIDITDDAGRHAARAVGKLAAIRGIPVVASTRPYGLSRLTLDAGWVYSRIAPLTRDQQKALVSHYFRAATDSDSAADSDEIIDRTVDDFLAQVHLVPELSAFSGTPLFLILLVLLRLSSSSQLPNQRFDVYDGQGIKEWPFFLKSQ